MKKLLFLLLLFFRLCGETTPYASAIASGDPSTFIHGCVSAITGDFFIAQDDIIVRGAKPLNIHRFMLSSHPQMKQHPLSFINSLSFDATEKDNHLMHLHITEPNGVMLYFHNTDAIKSIAKKHPSNKAKYYQVEQTFTLHPDSINQAVTNCSQAELGARLNYRNYTAKLSADKHYFYVNCGDGRKKIYERYYQSEKIVDMVIPPRGMFPEQEFYHFDYNYRLIKETLSDGSALYYSYAGDYFEKIRATNATGTLTYAWAQFAYHPNSVVVTTSDNRTLTYTLGGSLTVESPDHPREHLLFADKKLQKQERPNKRGYKLSYAGSTNRVEKLLAPAGKDATYHCLYSFAYPACGKNGKTHVFDPYGNETIYHYDNLRPTLIQTFRKEGGKQILLHEEKIAWGKENTPHVSYLLAKSFCDGNHTPLFSKRYHYDERGNVIKEQLFGNLSGKNSTPLELGSNSLPLENGCEVREIERRFSKTNLLEFEKQPNGAQTRYSYLPNTDLVVAKLVGDGSRNYVRHFFQYDPETLLLQEELIDDGITDSKNDLTGASQRKHITYTRHTSGPCIYLPHVIEEHCIDLSTGARLLRKKRLLSYTRHLQVCKEEIYDANDALRYTLTYDYDENGLLIAQTNPIGQKAVYSYDDNRNQTFRVDFPNTLEEKFTYDYANRCTSQELAPYTGSSHIETYAYDLLGNQISQTDYLQQTITTTYDRFGNPLKQTFPHIVAQNGKSLTPSTTATYTPAGWRETITDQNGNRTSFTYTILGKPILITHPDGSQERKHYNLDGTLREEIDQEGTKTTYTYDILGRVLQVNRYSRDGALLTQEKTTYNGFAPTTYTDPEGNVTTYEYNPLGQKSAETFNSTCERTEYLYDTLGNLHKTIGKCPAGDCIAIAEYDLQGRIIEKRLEDESGTVYTKQTYTYDQAGNCNSETTYPNNTPATATHRFDAFNRIIESTDELGNTTTTSYAERSSPLVKTTLRPNGVSIITTYDAHNAISKETIHGANKTTLSHEEYYYDARHNLMCRRSIVYAEGQKTGEQELNNTYDAMDRLATVTEGALTTFPKITSYTYTPSGMQKEVHKPDGTILYHTYDPLRRLEHLYASDGSIDYTFTYNKLGHLKAAEDQIARTITEREVDGKGRILRETLANGLSFHFTYDALGRKTSCTLPDGSSIAYAYTPFSLASISRYDAENTLLYTHTFDSFDLAGNLLRETLLGTLGSTTYAIHPLGMPYSLTSPYFTQTIDKLDTVGNILQMTRAGKRHTFSYDGLDQLTKEYGSHTHTYLCDSHHSRLKKDTSYYHVNDLHQLTEAGSETFIYDPNGNPIRHNDTTFTYDALDRLIEISTTKETHLFTYDSFHRRISHTTTTTHRFSEPTTTHALYLYDDQNEIGSATPDGAITQLRVLGETTQAEIGAAVAIELDNQIYAPIHDLQGNVATLLTTGGIALESYAYSAFGEEYTTNRFGLPQLTPAINPWRFSSKRTDTTSLVYFGRRYYMPGFGRWLTADPKGFVDGLNLYAYVHNTPLTHLDLYGLESTFWATKYKEWKKDYDLSVRIPTSEQVLDYGKGVAHAVSNALSVSTASLLYWNSPSFIRNQSVERASAASDRFMQRILPVDRASPDFKEGYESGTFAANLFPLIIPATASLKATHISQKGIQSLPSLSNKIRQGSKPVLQAATKKARKYLQPDSLATGAHSVFKRDPLCGNISKYATYKPSTNIYNPSKWELFKRFDGVQNTHWHYNKVTGNRVYTPHIHSNATPGGVRSSKKWETPK